MIGQRLSPILEEIEQTLWENEAHTDEKPNYTINGFRGGIKIFMSVMMDKMWELQEQDNIPIKNREEMSIKLGNEIRNLVKTYTNLDTHTLYK